MGLTIELPLEKTFTIGEGAEAFSITVKQATYGDHAQRDVLMSEVTRVFNDAEQGQVQVKTNWSLPDLIRKEAFLALVDCDIRLKGPDGVEAPLFQFRSTGGRRELAMTESAFNRAFNMLPLSVAQSIRERIVEVNMNWGPNPKE